MKYPYKAPSGAIFGHLGTSIAWSSKDEGYLLYGGPQKRKVYWTWDRAWKAFCRINDYPLDIEVNETH